MFLKCSCAFFIPGRNQPYLIRPPLPKSCSSRWTPGWSIGGRFYAAGATAPTLLFFHGNGEIVADYEDLGPLYARQGLNFFPVDYRGYGRSTGTPTVTAMIARLSGYFCLCPGMAQPKGVFRPPDGHGPLFG